MGRTDARRETKSPWKWKSFTIPKVPRGSVEFCCGAPHSQHTTTKQAIAMETLLRLVEGREVEKLCCSILMKLWELAMVDVLSAKARMSYSTDHERGRSG